MNNFENNQSLFGTDGIRGSVGIAPITPQDILKLGWAIGSILREGNNSPSVVIGKDTRISGYLLESALESGLSASGCNVILLGPMPTPAIAHITKKIGAVAGIVISASHNLYNDNGIKIFGSEGTKLPDELELVISKKFYEAINIVPSKLLGKAKRLETAKAEYIEYCLQNYKEINLTGLSCVIDCAHGATYQIAPMLFAQLGLNINVINAEPDGLNINLECGSTCLTPLSKRVKELKADFGIAFDGDGDRVLFVDHLGRTVDGDQLLYALAKAKQLKGEFSGGVVGTQMSNYGLELALKHLNIPFYRAKVGDRHVLQALCEKSWTLGGESSGHIILLDKTTTGDGIIAACQILQAMQELELSLAELVGDMEKMPQALINVPMPVKQDPHNHPKVKLAVNWVTEQLQNKGRVLLRCSGTEPLVRVMIEGQDANLVNNMAEYLAAVVKETFSLLTA